MDLRISESVTPPNVCPKSRQYTNVIFYLFNNYLNFKCEVLLQVLDNHDEEWQFDAECFCRICRTCQECCAANIIHEIMQLEMKTMDLLQKKNMKNTTTIFTINC